MSPETHLLASWIIAAKTTRNPRDCRLVTWAGVLPDADGLGLIVDLITQGRGGRQTFFYSDYHHWLFHGLFGAVLTSAALAFFARDRWRVAVWAFVVFHLHLLCDFVGSRGPSPQDIWPIYYLGPFSRKPYWYWSGQWRLDGWQNRWITVALFLWMLWLASKRGNSVVGAFNYRVDQVFCAVLRKWRERLWFGR